MLTFMEIILLNIYVFGNLKICIRLLFKSFLLIVENYFQRLTLNNTSCEQDIFVEFKTLFAEEILAIKRLNANNFHVFLADNPQKVCTCEQQRHTEILKSSFLAR